jgi:hypothetical protein
MASAEWSGAISMRTLTVYTDIYYKELDEATALFPRRVKRPELHYIKLYYDTFDADKFYDLLDYIAYQENPALKGMPQLAEITHKYVPASAMALNTQNLRGYVEKNRSIHLEGYVRFRMADYNLALNLLLYRIFRNIKP